MKLHLIRQWLNNQKILWQSIQTNPLIRFVSIITLLLILFSLIIILVSFSKLPPQVPLWYSKPWGTDRLDNPLWLFIFPVSNAFWYIVSTLCAIHCTKDYLVFSQILFLSSLFVSIFSTITLLTILWIIF